MRHLEYMLANASMLQISCRSEKEEASMGISRRTFIKACGGVVALGIIDAVPFTNWIRPVSAEGGEKEKVAYTFHPPNCGGRCSFKCTVREGKLVKIEPNEWPDSNHNKICLRGLSEVERVYSPDRLKTPLKRVGFQLITPFNMGTDLGTANGAFLVAGTFGGTNEISDFVNSNMVIIIGNNLLETSLTDAAFFFEAKETGKTTKLSCAMKRRNNSSSGIKTPILSNRRVPRGFCLN